MAKKSSELTRLVPKSIDVKIDGQTILVPFDSDENRIHNYILASQIRALIQSSIKKFADLEQPLSPKELKDIAEAGRSLAEFSAKIYEGEPLAPKTEKPAESAAIEADFSKLNKPDASIPSQNTSPANN